MIFQYTPLVWLLLVASVITLALGLIAWSQRQRPGAAPFLVLMLAATDFSFAYALQLFFASLPAQVLWLNVQYIGMVVMPVAWLVIILQVTDHAGWLTPRKLLLLAALPILTLIFSWTNSLHGLMYNNLALDTSGSFAIISKSDGVWFWVFVAYSYALVFTSIYLLLRSVPQTPPQHRRQPLALLAAIGVLLAANIVRIFNLLDWLRVDPTPFAMIPAGLIGFWALFRYRLLNIIPIARDTIFNSLQDGMIVLDDQNRVIDINQAGQKILSRPISAVLGAPAGQVFQNWEELIQVSQNISHNYAEMTIAANGNSQYYALKAAPLFNQRRQVIGRLVVLQNITEQKHTQEQLERLSHTDPLTGLANRRKFLENLEGEIARALRFSSPLSLIMLDIDHFKRVNDTYGHPVGDEALRRVAAEILGATRSQDLSARFGGDEFVILLPHTPRIGAERLAKRLLESVQKIVLKEGVSISLSGGIAFLCPEDDGQGKSFLARADRALYAAKQAGRNRIIAG